MHAKHTISAKTLSGAVLLASGLLAACTTDDASSSSSTVGIAPQGSQAQGGSNGS